MVIYNGLMLTGVPDQAFWHLLGGHDQELTKTRCEKHVSTRKKNVDLSNVKWDNMG